MLKIAAFLITASITSLTFPVDITLAQSASVGECRRAFSIINSRYSDSFQRAEALSGLFKEYPECYEVWDAMNQQNRRRNDRYIEQRRRQTERDTQRIRGIMDMLE